MPFPGAWCWARRIASGGPGTSTPNPGVSTTMPEKLDVDVPPAIHCYGCETAECSGCDPGHPETPQLELTWESAAGPSYQRLWQTALTVSTNADVFSRLPEGSLGRALAFAMLAELSAVASLSVTTLVLARLLLAEWTTSWLASGHGAVMLVALTLLVAGLMVVLHLLWGVCIELGGLLTGCRPDFAQGLRFGLYACGWDLLTSPAGVCHGVLMRGWQGAWPPIWAAARVPSRALHAYVNGYRQMPAFARRRGIQLSIGVLTPVTLLAVVGLLMLGVLAL